MGSSAGKFLGFIEVFFSPFVFDFSFFFRLSLETVAKECNSTPCVFEGAKLHRPELARFGLCHSIKAYLFGVLIHFNVFSPSAKGENYLLGPNMCGAKPGGGVKAEASAGERCSAPVPPGCGAFNSPHSQRNYFQTEDFLLLTK